MCVCMCRTHPGYRKYNYQGGGDDGKYMSEKMDKTSRLVRGKTTRGNTIKVNK